MINIYKKLIIIITLFFISSLVYSQTNEIKIKFIGNCGLYMTDGDLNIYIDFPYKSGAHKYMEYNSSELDKINDSAIFLFTHRHSDHYSKRLLRKIQKEREGKVYGNWNVKELKELNDSEQDFSIQAIKTSHKFTFKHYSYLLTWHNRKIYINGDTGDFEPVSKIDNIEWAFVPYWLYDNARRNDITVNTKMLGIYHLHPYQEIPSGWPENVLFLTEQNEIFRIMY